LSDTFTATELGYTLFSAQAIQNNADLLFRTILFAGFTLDVPNKAFGL